MANYVSKYTGAKIDEAVGKALSGVTAAIIKTALGYTPADATKVEALEKEVANGITDEDKAAIALQVLDMIEDDSVQIVVDENKNITLTCENDGVYTIKYYNKDGSTTTISTLTVSSGSGSGSGGTEEPEEPDTPVEPDEPDDPVVTPTGNLFVASTCTLNKRISNSSGLLTDQDQTFVTDYINIGNCMASGGTNQIHFRGFLMYKAALSETGGTLLPGMGDFYRTITYYDANNEKLGQDSYYNVTFVGDANGDGVITLDATYTTATKIRVCGAIGSADLTSTDQLSGCIITLNELITD